MILRRSLFIFCLVLAESASAEFALRPAAANSATRAFLKATLDRVPPAVSEAAGEPITVDFALNAPWPDDICEAELGELQLSVWDAKTRTISLHAALEPLVQAGPAGEVIPCLHRSLWDAARGAIIEQLVEIWEASRSGGRLAESAAFRKLSGWQTWMFRPNLKNTNESRSPDPRERVSSGQFLAVNIGYFLLDPEFRCRRPAMNLYLEKQLGEAFPVGSCDPFTQVVLSHSRIFLDISPERVQDVHYLLAASGSNVVSGFGHTMIRLVVGDDKETAMENVGEHVVMAYQALTLGDLALDHIGGLLGKYPSQLFAYIFPHVLTRYTAGEMRELRSMPIAFTDEQRRLFVYRSLENFWQYSGKYRFLSHNCATESRDDIQASFYEGHKFLKDDSNSPGGIAKAMIKMDLLDLKPFEDKEAATAAGYFFPDRNRVNTIYRQLRERATDIKFIHASNFLNHSSGKYRREFYTHLLTEDPQANVRLASEFYNFEIRVRVKTYEDLFKAALKHIRKEAKKAKSNPDLKVPSYEAYLRAQEIFDAIMPWNTLPVKTGYGVPLPDEVFDAENEAYLEGLQSELIGLRDMVIGTLKDSQPKLHGRHQDSIRNASFFTRESMRFQKALIPQAATGQE
ncbi:MAG: hypothetical protein ACI8W8_003260 [Rhodothermales bacterium]|jgi:hypothetical protein